VAAPQGFDIPKKSKNNKEVSITFDVPGIYYYWCTPHKSMGMIALIVVGDDTSNKDAIAKAKAMGKSKKILKALLSEL
jgi:pseudoazurin